MTLCERQKRRGQSIRVDETPTTQDRERPHDHRVVGGHVGMQQGQDRKGDPPASEAAVALAMIVEAPLRGLLQLAAQPLPAAPHHVGDAGTKPRILPVAHGDEAPFILDDDTTIGRTPRFGPCLFHNHIEPCPESRYHTLLGVDRPLDREVPSQPATAEADHVVLA
jgi:hypothetical protein